MIRRVTSCIVLTFGLIACNTQFTPAANRPSELSGRLFISGSHAKPVKEPALGIQALRPSPNLVPGELVVSLEPDANPDAVFAGISGIQSWQALSPTTLTLRTQIGQEADVLEQLRARPEVRAASGNRRLSALAVPNDSRFAQQSNLNLIGMPAAWDIQKGSGSVRVAVLDDGYDPKTTDMQGRILLPTPPGGYYLDPGDRDNDPTALNGSSLHGEEVASIIAAATNNAMGIAGVTWQGVQVIPIKVESRDPNTNEAAIFVSTLAAGINTAVRLRVNVINISLGLEGSDERCLAGANDPAIDAALKSAYEAGILILASSGNDSLNTVCYPASSRYVLAVGSVNNNKGRSDFSTGGPQLDLVAPGAGVLALNPSGVQMVSGTSFSAPTVAGVAALLASQGYTSPDTIAARLIETSEDLGVSGRDNDFGNGMVRADRALSSDTPNGDPLMVTLQQSGRTVRQVSSIFADGRSQGAYSISNLVNGAYTVRAHLDANGDGIENSGDLVGQRNVSYPGGGYYAQDIVLTRLP